MSLRHEQTGDSSRFVGILSDIDQAMNQDLEAGDAERLVTKALKAKEYDDAITTASTALARMDKMEPKQVINSRKAILWARSKAYKAKGLLPLSLSDARKVLKLSPEDPEAYVRAAKLLAASGYPESAERCLDTATEKIRNRPSENDWDIISKIEKQRYKLKLKPSSISPIARLPTEVVLQILDYLYPHSHLKLANVCRAWRNLVLGEPRFWRHLATRKFSMASNAVQTYAQRSRNTLEHVQLKGFISPSVLTQILANLSPSAETLNHLALPTTRQAECYTKLYKLCPNLKSLDVRIEGHSSGRSRDDRTIFCEEVAPFQLEVFRGDGYNQGDPIPYMSKLKVIQNLCHDPASYQHYYAPFFVSISRLADTLEEWHLASDCIDTLLDFGENLPHISSGPFTKLKRLHGWVLGSMLDFRFPVLEEATAITVNPRVTEYGQDSDQEELGTADLAGSELLASPKLRKLGLNLSDAILTEKEVGSIMRSVCQLEDLEELSLRFRDRFELQNLFPSVTRYAYARSSEFKVPCKRLRRLTLDCPRPDSCQLAKLLALRYHLAEGKTFEDAQRIAKGLLRPISKPKAISISPFQRGSVSSNLVQGAPAERPVHSCNDPHLRAMQSTASDVSRIEEVQLLNVEELPPGLQHLLEQFTNLKLQFRPL